MSSLPKRAPDTPVEEDLGRTSEAAWVIDVDTARVAGASPAGGAFCSGALREGVVLDRAMPALQQLRQFVSDEAGRSSPGAEQERILLIWAAGGVTQLRCSCRLLGGEGRRVLVRAAELPAGEATDQRGPAAGPARALLAHELRTPLSAIAALAEVMKEERLGPMGNPRYLTYAADIHESARHALGVLGAMMGDAGDRNAQQEASDAVVDEIVARCMAVMRELARKASVRLVTDLVPGGLRLAVDHRSLMQILINLLSNALKFTAPGGEVKIATQRLPDGGLVLSVADTGCGMSRDALACAAGGMAQGSGYGLPVVAALAQASGATVNIASAPGEGTRVSIVFPPDRVSGPEHTVA